MFWNPALSNKLVSSPWSPKECAEGSPLGMISKYYVIEPYYIDESTPDQLTAFVSESKCLRRWII